ncbi:hypothetical protein HDU98_001554 [Podochytrium sp. JEL0797]|nr:hypothetical protein HDU98_001554 [Podochytrium sp. JEL0797]
MNVNAPQITTMNLLSSLALLAVAASTALASQDVVMLSDCSDNYHGDTKWIDWYPTVAASQAGQPGSSSSNGKQDYQGNEFTIQYSDGNQLTVNVFANTLGNSFGTYSGYAWNNYHSFYCYRDNGRLVYSTDYYPNGNIKCYAQYYCM